MIDKFDYKSIKEALQLTWQITCQELKNVFTDSGVIIIFFAFNKGLLSSMGSMVSASMAAPPKCPEFKASGKAFSSISCPLDILRK